MNLSVLDWSIIIFLLLTITSAAIYTRRYTRSVADFLAANRTAGRYLLCIADGMSGVGAISIIAMFEVYYTTGFVGAWWDTARFLIVPTILSLSGWVIYRFRQTRALTLAQFFEMRYSKRFRVFAGILAWIAGIVNFGIFPAVGARFFINYLNIPDTTPYFCLTMGCLISVAMFFTFLGGQIAVMVTDFIQGVFCNIMFVIIIFFVLSKFAWPQIFDVLAQAPENASMLNPFKVTKAKDFDTLYYACLILSIGYGFMAWQGSQGYNAAAINPHEARMGKSLSSLRLLLLNTFAILLPVCAFTFMTHPAFASEAIEAKTILSGMTDEVMQKQATTPLALKYMLPSGVMGGFCAIMLAAFISTHDTYLHSWGSIFIQDVVLPFRKRTLSQKEHINLLRWSIFGVAIFIFFFSLLFKQNEYIYMFFSITAAIFSGAGACIIGGLYWKRGTTNGAWAGMVSGALLAITFTVIKQINSSVEFDNFVLKLICNQNGLVLGTLSSVFAVVNYVTFSLVEAKIYNIDKLLHRNEYAISEDNAKVTDKKTNKYLSMIGINQDFNLSDKIIYIFLILLIATIVIVFTMLTVCNMAFGISLGGWKVFWKYLILSFFALGSIGAIWLTIGGIRDLIRMFKLLNEKNIIDEDDGTVTSDE